MDVFEPMFFESKGKKSLKNVLPCNTGFEAMLEAKPKKFFCSTGDIGSYIWRLYWSRGTKIGSH
jgi:hypothetical protein